MADLIPMFLLSLANGYATEHYFWRAFAFIIVGELVLIRQAIRRAEKT